MLIKCCTRQKASPQRDRSMLRIFRQRTWPSMAAIAAFAAVPTFTGGAKVSATPPLAAASTPHVSQAAVRDRLPDLVPFPPEALHVAYENGRKVLRFTASVENRGDGPLEVVGSRSSTATPDLKVVQNIYQTNGHVRPVRTNAIMRYSAADDHDHFHLQGFEQYRLRPVGSRVWRGAHKEGFCLRDDVNVGGKAPFHYDGDCGSDEPGSLRVSEGLSVGWVDVYSWELWGQFIDLDGLRLPGDFCVSVTADPSRHLTEKTRSNNTASTLVHITPSAATVIRQGC